MESEEILGPQFIVHWSTCSSIPGKRFPITRSELGKISVKWTKYSGKKLIPPMEEHKSILELFDCGYLADGIYLRSIGIGSV